MINHILWGLKVIDEAGSLVAIPVRDSEDNFFVIFERGRWIMDNESPTKAINVLGFTMGMIPVSPGLLNLETCKYDACHVVVSNSQQNHK